jgi:hypothetical protein
VIARPSGNAWKYGPNGVTSYPCCFRFSSRMIVGGISDITYEYVVTLISGGRGTGRWCRRRRRSCRGLEHDGACAVRAKYAPLVSRCARRR